MCSGGCRINNSLALLRSNNTDLRTDRPTERWKTKTSERCGHNIVVSETRGRLEVMGKPTLARKTLSEKYYSNNNNNNTRLAALFRDYPGEPVPET